MGFTSEGPESSTGVHWLTFSPPAKVALTYGEESNRSPPLPQPMKELPAGFSLLSWNCAGPIPLVPAILKFLQDGLRFHWRSSVISRPVLTSQVKGVGILVLRHFIGSLARLHTQKLHNVADSLCVWEEFF